MTRRTRTSSIVAASVLALAGCAHPGSGSATGRDSGQAGIVAIGSPSPTATDTATQDTTGNQDNGSNSGTGNGSNSGNGGGTHTSPSPSTAPTGPRIISFTASGAVCPSAPQGVPYSTPGEVTLSWKIANADTVDLLMDGGLWKSYPGAEGSDKLNFECSLNPPRQKVTHTYTLVIKNTNVKKTVSASAYSNPSS
jgi:hypothetical protein